MNYNEFIYISKENMDNVTYEVYSKEIEPCYNWLPEVNSKKEFINWWKKNKDLCRSISNVLVQLKEAERCISILMQEKQGAIMCIPINCASNRIGLGFDYTQFYM